MVFLDILVDILLLEEIAVRGHHAVHDRLERDAAAVEWQLKLLRPTAHANSQNERAPLFLSSKLIPILEGRDIQLIL